MLFSNEGAANTHGDFHSRQVSSMAHQFMGHYLLVSLPCGDKAVHSRSPSLSVHFHATLGFQAREGFWLLLFPVVGKVRTRTAWSRQVPKGECFGARRRCLPENPLRLSVGCLLEGPVSQDS